MPERRTSQAASVTDITDRARAGGTDDAGDRAERHEARHTDGK